MYLEYLNKIQFFTAIQKPYKSNYSNSVLNQHFFLAISLILPKTNLTFFTSFPALLLHTYLYEEATHIHLELNQHILTKIDFKRVWKNLSILNILNGIQFLIQYCLLWAFNANNSMTNSTDNLTFYAQNANLPTWPVLFLLVFAFVGFFGNLLVCMAIRIDPKLQSATNSYLFSLACTDLLVSVLVIPLSIQKSYFKIWKLSDSACLLFVFSDVFLCNTSILQLCIISCVINNGSHTLIPTLFLNRFPKLRLSFLNLKSRLTG
ncbi:5-hydroxytryptamine receptor 2A [Brachionus plicatilis]|uniref:5-hydroxytryptamine receptor 2A n=1 Tax=Brachionus plicatilis TaxID=10195 RepID=A0A3M7QXT9_BRAPC|nr:5-hydroxytryptamine receptor 2A [Brachionus plicatilis]